MPTLQEAFINALINSAGPLGAARGATQPPAMDLGRISIQKQAPTPLPQAALPSPPQTQVSSSPTSQPTQTVQQPNKMWEFIKAIAPQAIAAGVGMAAPGTLPMASGFSQGLTGEQQRQKLAKESGQSEEAKFQRDKELKGMEGGPTWTQNQKIQMIKDAVKRKKISIAREFGDPIDFDLSNEQAAIKAIQNLGFDPQLFSADLADAYGMKQAKFTSSEDQYSKAKQWLIENPNDPDAEAVKQKLKDLGKL